MGLSPVPTIDIYRLSDNVLVVNDAPMEEVGGGTYEFDFGANSPSFDENEEYAAIAFASALANPSDQYASGAFGFDDIQKDIRYQDGLHIDTTGGGTAGTAYPIGTRQVPVSNITDLRTIAVATGVRKIYVRGNITLNNSFIGYEWIALAGGGVITGGGQDAGGSIFRNIGITGVFASTSDMFAFENTFVGTTTDFRGVCIRAGFGGTVIVEPGQILTLAECASIVAGTSTPIVTVAGVGTELNLRAYSGGLTLTGMNDATSRASLEFAVGQCILNADNTLGTIVVRGLLYLTDNSGGATVVKQGFLDPRGKVDIEQ